MRTTGSASPDDSSRPNRDRVTRRIDRWLAVLSFLLPRARRDGWRRHWRAELLHHRSLRRRHGLARPLDLVRHAIGALVDAVTLRLDEWREGLLFDFRLAWRSLRHRPASAALMITVLALGIGGSVLVGGVIDSILLAPLPYPDPDRLVRLWEVQTTAGLAPIILDNNRYGGAESRQYYRQIRETLEAVPGITSVGATTVMPMSSIGPDFDRPVWAEGRRPATGNERQADMRMATPNLFDTLRIELQRGRDFGEQDEGRSQPVTNVNRTLADRLWPGHDPIGETLHVDLNGPEPMVYEVIGMIADVRRRGLREPPRPEFYVPHAQRPYLITGSSRSTRWRSRRPFSASRSPA